MAEAQEYSALGFKCGLEIHQRLATKEKLFCSCDASLPEDIVVMDILRRQRAVAGETGKFDVSTNFESRRGRTFTYRLFRRSTCLVDIDEEPPHRVNPEALSIALRIAASLNAKVPDEIEPMRKEVVDGSDPSAFQRSLLCGYAGSIEVDGKRIDIPSIFLEEESSGIEPASSTVLYNVSRLGIPLIEIDTSPIISSPEEAKRVASQLGLLLRLTGSVQRGIGSIRQDVNVSIKGGARIEIKGFQDLENMDKIIETEVRRQLALIAIQKELSGRAASVSEALDVTGLFKKTNSRIIRQHTERNGRVLASKLVNFSGIMGREICDGKRLGSEVSEYAKKAGVKGIIHSDEDLAAYDISEEERQALIGVLGMGRNDAFMLVAAEKGVCERAMQLARGRAEAAMRGVPEETRSVELKSFATRFMRPLPGGSRMYPETDVLPISSAPFSEEAAKGRVSIEQVRKALYAEIGTQQLAEQMLWSKELPLYLDLKARSKADPKSIAALLLERFREMGRKGVEISLIGKDALLFLLDSYATKSITRPALFSALESLPKSGSDAERVIIEKKLHRLGRDKLRRLIEAESGKDRKEIFDDIMGGNRLTVDAEELRSMLGISDA